MESTVTAKGQTTIPKEVREHLHLKPGDKIKFFIGPDGRVAILPTIPVTALKGILKSRRRRAPTLEEMDEGIGAAVAARYRRAGGK